MSFRLLLLFVALFEVFIHVHSWGPVGHSIIARLAQSQLTDPARDWVNYLVPWYWNGNLSAMASWADDIIHDDSNPTGYGNWQWTRRLHYINTPDWFCNYEVNRDCLNDTCVDGAIRNYTKRLQTKLDDIQHQEALYFLIHYVADIHQPLHVGFKNDFGGNIVRGRFMNVPRQTNLHSLWDSGIITHRVQKDFYSNTSLYYKHIYDIMINQASTVNDTDIEQWIKEDLKIVCEEVYFNDNNTRMNSSSLFNLGNNYFSRSIPIIEQRLAQGGRRLGALLNELGKTRPRNSSENKLCISIFVLIAVLCVEFILGVV